MIVKKFKMILMSERHFIVTETELQFFKKSPGQKVQANHLTLETYSEPCQTSTLVLLSKITNGSQPSIIFTKSSILDVWHTSLFFVLQKQILICLKTEYFHSAQMIFYCYNTFDCERKFREMQGISSFQTIQTKSIFSRFNFD